jgi:RNase P/RNase MRP subunit POP5
VPVRSVRRRYIDFKVSGGADLAGSEVFDALASEFRLLYGVKGLSEAGLKLIEYDAAACRGVVRCNHAHLTGVRAALARLVELGGAPASIQVELVSGTIRSLRGAPA